MVNEMKPKDGDDEGVEDPTGSLAGWCADDGLKKVRIPNITYSRGFS